MSRGITTFGTVAAGPLDTSKLGVIGQGPLCGHWLDGPILGLQGLLFPGGSKIRPLGTILRVLGAGGGAGG